MWRIQNRDWTTHGEAGTFRLCAATSSRAEVWRRTGQRRFRRQESTMQSTFPSLLKPDGIFSLMADALSSPAPGSEGPCRNSMVDAAPSPAPALRPGVLRRVGEMFSSPARAGGLDRRAFVPYY
jgi:hypothetical protein